MLGEVTIALKAFVIRDSTDRSNKDLAYLFYDETVRQFRIELPEDADPWETPLLLSSFVKRGEFSVDPHWSLLWVQQRIVPVDRQNIAQILRDNGLKEYDEFSLLMLASGKCAQDDYYLTEITAAQLPWDIARRIINMDYEVLITQGGMNRAEKTDEESVEGLYQSGQKKPIRTDTQKPLESVQRFSSTA